MKTLKIANFEFAYEGQDIGCASYKGILINDLDFQYLFNLLSLEEDLKSILEYQDMCFYDMNRVHRILIKFEEYLGKNYGVKKEDYSEIAEPASYTKNWRK